MSDTPASRASSSADDQYEISRQVKSQLPTNFSDKELSEMVADVPRSVSEAQSEIQRRESRSSDFWALLGCNLIVFVSSVCIMVVELCASRLIASYLGSSLYTWTSVIGVVLAGITVGNYVGGWIADKFDPRKVLGWQFLFAGLATAGILALNQIALQISGSRPESISWQLWVMLLVALVFLPPSLVLGTISPVTASLAIKRSQRTGITVGNIYAWGAMGSIVGTFIAGFWLIDELGTKHIIWITASVLLAMGAIVSGSQRALRVFLLFGAMQYVLILGILSAATAEQVSLFSRYFAEAANGFSTNEAQFLNDREQIKTAEETQDQKQIKASKTQLSKRLANKKWEDEWAIWGDGLGQKLHDVGLQMRLRRDHLGEFNDESDYYAINIYPAIQDGEQVKILRLDYLIHSYYNPSAPNRLHYDYEQVYAAITERAAKTWNRQTSDVIAEIPNSPQFQQALPVGVEYDPVSRRLNVRGALSIDDAIQLLSILPDSDFVRAITHSWRIASENWKTTTQFTSGKLSVPFDVRPETQLFIDEMRGTVYYDPNLQTLVFTAPFSLERAFDALAIGPARSYVLTVRDLYMRSRQTSTLFIGGGGFIFPRWVEAEFPHYPRIDVAEIDPAVLAAVQKEMGLKTKYGPPSQEGTFIKTTIGDARKFVDDRVRENELALANQKEAVRYDFIYGDAFNDLSVPWHLTTREFSEKVHSLLTPNEGVYLVNIIDVFPRAKSPGRKATALGEDHVELAAPLPPDLFPETEKQGVWYTSLVHPQLQIRRNGKDNYAIAYRGVLDDTTRDELIAKAGSDATFARAMKIVQRVSQTEKVGRFLGRYVETVREVFPYVYVFTSNDNEDPSERRDTFIVACSLKKLSFENLFASGNYWHSRPFAASEQVGEADQRLDSGDMTALRQLSRGIQLTDDFAPVDNLLAPVFATRNEDED